MIAEILKLVVYVSEMQSQGEGEFGLQSILNQGAGDGGRAAEQRLGFVDSALGICQSYAKFNGAAVFQGSLPIVLSLLETEEEKVVDGILKSLSVCAPSLPDQLTTSIGHTDRGKDGDDKETELIGMFKDILKQHIREGK